MSKPKVEDPVMDAIRRRFAESGMSRQELGEKMGYAPASARQSVYLFLKTGDPQISMVRRFAEAMGISVHTLLK